MSLRNSNWLVFVFRSGKSLVFTNNATRMTSKTRDWLHTVVQQPKFKVQSKIAPIVADVGDPATPSHSIYSRFLFTVCVEFYDVP